MEGRQGVRRTIAPHKSQCGQILTMFLIFLIPLTVAGLSVYNVGMITTEKMKLQNAADNAAYSAAVWDARYLNLTAYTTRAMVANYDTIALMTGLWSFFDALDGFIAQLQNITFLGQAIPLIGAAFTALHTVLADVIHPAIHNARHGIAVVHGNADDHKAVPFGLEEYNQVLSSVEKAVYVLTQAGRMQLIREVAGGVDRNFESWPGAEVFNIGELKQSVNDGPVTTDEDNGLRLTVEHSLNAFSNGDSIRDADNLLPGPLRAVKNVVDTVANNPICGACLDVGPHGFDGPGFDHVTGAESPAESLPSGSPSCGSQFGSSGTKQQIVHNERIYQLDRSGIFIEIGTGILCSIVPGLPFTFGAGHNSDDQFNQGSFLTEHKFDGTFGGAADPQLRTDNNHPGDVDDNDESPPCRSPSPPFGTFAGFVQLFNVVLNDCRTEYKFKNELKDVRITLYNDDGDKTDDGDRREGPRTFVYLRKSADRLPLFGGLGLSQGIAVPGANVQGTLVEPFPTHTQAIEAYAFARTYMTQRRRGNRPDSKFNRETALNPFWAGRLERLSENNVELLH